MKHYVFMSRNNVKDEQTDLFTEPVRGKHVSYIARLWSASATYTYPPANVENE